MIAPARSPAVHRPVAAPVALAAGTGYAGAGHICATVLIGMLAATAAAVGGLLFARRVQ